MIDLGRHWLDDSTRRPQVIVKRNRLTLDYEVRCSECGLLYELDEPIHAAGYAHRHAEAIHDGDVIREGWT